MSETVTIWSAARRMGGIGIIVGSAEAVERENTFAIPSIDRQDLEAFGFNVIHKKSAVFLTREAALRHLRGVVELSRETLQRQLAIKDQYLALIETELREGAL